MIGINKSKDEIIKEIGQIAKNKMIDDSEGDIVLIGIAGIPGSGKTTLSSELISLFPQLKFIPMDGYHIYRKDLDENGLLFRGAPFTFNSSKFKSDLLSLKEKGMGSFPSFDHSEKDPKEDAIVITKTDKVIIVEGLYLFCKDWGINDIFDIKVYLECSPEDAELRVSSRHVRSGIEPNFELALERFRRNDFRNARYVKENSLLDERTFLLNTSGK